MHNFFLTDNKKQMRGNMKQQKRHSFILGPTYLMQLLGRKSYAKEQNPSQNQSQCQNLWLHWLKRHWGQQMYLRHQGREGGLERMQSSSLSHLRWCMYQSQNKVLVYRALEGESGFQFNSDVNNVFNYQSNLYLLFTL